MLGSLSTGGFLKKNQTQRWFLEYRQQNSRIEKTRVSSLILLNFLDGKMWVENQTKTPVWEDSSLCPETSTLNALQEFHVGEYAALKFGTEVADIRRYSKFADFLR